MGYYKKNTGASKVSVYDIVSDRIIAILEKGVIPWQKPCSYTPPVNLISKKPYRGINTLLLKSGYSSPYWLSYKQAKFLGGHVNEGEKGSVVVFWTIFEKDKKDSSGNIIYNTNGEPVKEKIPVLRYYTVFNSEQCTLPEGKVPEAPAREGFTAAESVVENFEDCPEIVYGNFGEGSYLDATDTVQIPVVENFVSTEEFHATLFHELAHSTRHAKRLNRKETAESHDAEYGKEELVAEIAAAFLGYETGISPKIINNQAAYVQGWLDALRADKKLIVLASGAAQKAADYILRNNKTVQAVEEQTSEDDVPTEDSPEVEGLSAYDLLNKSL